MSDENNICHHCNLYEGGERLGEYINFHVIDDKGTPTAVWYLHETEKEICQRMCPCKITKMIETLNSKARRYYGDNKFVINKINDTGHFHITATKNG